MKTQQSQWLSTEAAAREVGMTSEWIRKQIIAGRLQALAWNTGGRRTYRISREEFETFLVSFTGDPEEGDEAEAEADPTT